MDKWQVQSIMHRFVDGVRSIVSHSYVYAVDLRLVPTFAMFALHELQGQFTTSTIPARSLVFSGVPLSQNDP